MMSRWGGPVDGVVGAAGSGELGGSSRRAAGSLPGCPLLVKVERLARRISMSASSAAAAISARLARHGWTTPMGPGGIPGRNLLIPDTDNQGLTTRVWQSSGRWEGEPVSTREAGEDGHGWWRWGEESDHEPCPRERRPVVVGVVALVFLEVAGEGGEVG